MTMQSLGRRAFLQGSTLLLSGGLLPMLSRGELNAAPTVSQKPFKIGLITDLHYADKPTAGKRHYQDTPQKLRETATKFQEEQVAFVVELGDLIDSAPSLEIERGHLKTINEQFSQIATERYYVLGNHCVESLTKQEFLSDVGQETSYFSIDRNGFHFIVLDACFRSDGVPYGRKNSNWTDAFIPPEEVEWLRKDLEKTTSPAIVFAHQRLDVAGKHAVKNANEIRKLLEASGKVSAVFQGHSHANDYQEINGIHYCTLVAMVEGPAPDSNGYSVLSLSTDATLQLTGFRMQENRLWKPVESKSP